MNKIRFTKKRDKALNTALCFDDYLYAKHVALMDEVYKANIAYVKNPKKLWDVVRRTKDGNYIREQVLSCEVDGGGTRVIIGE